MKTYSGAGILPLIIINKNYYFITFKLLNNLLTDAGGKKEEKNNVLDTACRELFEESAGLIKLDKLTVKNNSIHIDIGHKDKYYRCYIVLIDNIDKKIYQENLKKINKFLFNPFGETKDIKLIKINKILYLKKSNKVSPRLKNIFIELLKLSNIKKLKNLIKTNNIIELNKIKHKIKTYEYYTNKKIIIKNIKTFIS